MYTLNSRWFNHSPSWVIIIVLTYSGFGAIQSGSYLVETNLCHFKNVGSIIVTPLPSPGGGSPRCRESGSARGARGRWSGRCVDPRQDRNHRSRREHLSGARVHEPLAILTGGAGTLWVDAARGRHGA